jgi:hypothetical protein
MSAILWRKHYRIISENDKLNHMLMAAIFKMAMAESSNRRRKAKISMAAEMQPAMA